MNTPPGELTESSPGQTDRVAAILAKNAAVPVRVADGITVEQARQLTDEIKVDAETLWDKLTRAYTERAWDVLGYESWDSYCTTEFQSLRLRLPLEERQDVVCSLREAGLSIRAIAAGVGISDQTVQRDLKAGVVNHYTSPEVPGEAIDAEVVDNSMKMWRDHFRENSSRNVEPPNALATVTGLDGKTHPKFRPTPRPPRPSGRRNYTSSLTPIRVALRDVPDQVARFDSLADDEQFCAWLAEKATRVVEVRREITKAVEQLQRMGERVQLAVGQTITETTPPESG